MFSLSLLYIASSAIATVFILGALLQSSVSKSEEGKKPRREARLARDS